MEHSIQLDDILVLGTDGLRDNLFDSDIIAVIEERMKNNKVDLQTVSDQLACLAEIKSYDQQYESPFTIEMKKDTG